MTIGKDRVQNDEFRSPITYFNYDPYTKRMDFTQVLEKFKSKVVAVIDSETENDVGNEDDVEGHEFLEEQETALADANVSTRVWGKQKVCTDMQIESQTDKHTDEAQIQTIQLKPVEVDEKMVYVEESALDDIVGDLQILKGIAADMNQLIDVETENLEELHDNLQSTETHVQKAGDEIEQALKYSKESKFKKGVIVTTGTTAAGAAIGSIAGPPGAVFGAGVGAAVGMVGSVVHEIVDN